MPDLKLSDYMENFKNCIQYEKPYCQVACPFHIDINDLIEKIKQGNYNSAYKIYRNAVGFPYIVSKICSQPCKNVCPMKDHGSAIELRNLEEGLIEHANRKDPTSYNIPQRPGKVAIIGSGLAGLGALLRMATKKYETHIFEKDDRIGGMLNVDDQADLFIDEINKQLKHEKYELHLNTEITTREQINQMGFNVVFVATGKDSNNFGILDASDDTDDFVLLDGKTAWFAGGALIGDENIYALAGGLNMGIVLESYLKTGTINYNRDAMNTEIIIDSDKIKEQQPIPPVDSIYTKDESTAEAKRCLQCQCNFCRTYEDLTAFYDKWPLRIKDEVFATTLEGSSEVKATPAKRLMSTSNLTGITKVVCPKDIDLDNLILAGRQKMHRLEKAPWAFHDFWLKDMEFANGENAEIIRLNPSSLKSDYAFFPGCQLGASVPALVDKSYELLLSIDPSMGMILRCCGSPALWSGDEDMHEAVLAELKIRWEDLGSPTLITACPTCTDQLSRYLPDIKTISLYEYLDNNFNDITTTTSTDDTYSIFDPCSTRENKNISEAIRNLTKKMGIKDEELPDQSEIPRCCSFGGQPMIANPQYTDYVIDKRINEGDLPYITYCINCRDSFAKADKKTKHILELILNTEKKSVPTVSERRDNRVFLKKSMLNKYWGDNMNDSRAKYDFELIIPENILQEMDTERILEEDIYNVVDFMNKTNRKVIDPGTGIHSGYRQIGYMTYWVSFKETDKKNTFEITDVYNHRMEIELEAVWNGIKTEIDM